MHVPTDKASTLHAPRRFPQWTPLELAAALEGLCVLIGASMLIRILPFRKIAALSSRGPGGRYLNADASRLWVRVSCWAVEGWGRRVPWKAVCFQRGLALHIMLRRHFVNSVLHYGVTQSASEGLKAHVWVSVGGTVVLGGETSDDFACLATFPQQERSG